MIGKRSMFVWMVVIGLIFSAGDLFASSCVDCHTDTEKLQAIAKTLPQKVGSAETAGKG